MPWRIALLASSRPDASTGAHCRSTQNMNAAVFLETLLIGSRFAIKSHSSVAASLEFYGGNRREDKVELAVAVPVNPRQRCPLKSETDFQLLLGIDAKHWSLKYELDGDHWKGRRS